MKLFWTIENVGVPGGSEKEIAEWGVDDIEATFSSQAEDEVSLSANGRKFDAAYLFDYKSTVIIRRDRRREANGTFSGGSNYFTGIAAHPHVGGSGRREFQKCSIVGPWWYLNERGFEQEYKQFDHLDAEGQPVFKNPNPTKARIFLNLKLGEYGQVTAEKLSTGEQLTEVLNWTLKPFTDTATPPPFQIGTIGLAVDAPVDEVKNITCAEAARKMLRWSPDAVAWFDHTTSPPTFNCKRRASLATFNVDIRTLKPTGLSVTPLFHLQRPFVKIQYERSNTDNGTTWEQTLTDVYPDPQPTGALNQFSGLPFVVDLRGYTRNQPPPVTIETKAIDTASNDWWIGNEPDYERATEEYAGAAPSVTSIVVDPASVVVKTENDETDLNLPNQLVGGTPADWIKVGNDAAKWQRLTLTVKAAVTFSNGGFIPDKTFSLQVVSTNAVSGTYSATPAVDAGDPVPVNLARDFYEAVSHVPYEGSLEFRPTELGGTPRLGHKLNILGSDNVDWETMDTLVQRVTESIQRRTVNVEFGTPPHLALADMVALLRVSRNRDPQNPYSMRTGGGAHGGAGHLTAHTARQNSGTALGNWQKIVASGPGGSIKHLADSGTTTPNGIVESSWTQGASPKIVVRPIEVGSQTQARFRKFEFYDSANNCKKYRAWFLMTDPEPVPDGE